MQFKPKVTLTDQNGWRLCMGSRASPVAPKDVYLAKAIAQGVGDIEQLKTLIANAEAVDEVAAALVLARFILDYGDFIAEDSSRETMTD